MAEDKASTMDINRSEDVVQKTCPKICNTLWAWLWTALTVNQIQRKNKGWG